MNGQETKSILELSRILNLLFYDSLTGNYLSGLKPRSLTQNQFSILKILNASGPLLVNEVADMMKISHAAASKNIDILVNLNFVSRKTVTGDRRKVIVSVLKSGQEIVQEFEILLTKKQNGGKTSLTKNELEILQKLLIKYVHGFLTREENLEFICANCAGSNSNECPLLNYDIHCRFSNTGMGRL
jgi:DNA-binding MarR family transcriptional regulator